jgi:protocatechuate 3,4-dioxygenase beta subunit
MNAHSVALLLVAALAATMLAIPAPAQTSRGSVVGTVTDVSGGAIPGTAVELTHTATGVIRSAITNDAGIYRFDAVDLGDYDLRIARPGFKTFITRGFGVEANRATTMDSKMELGGSETTIEVRAETAAWLVKDAPLRGANFKPQ